MGINPPRQRAAESGAIGIWVADFDRGFRSGMMEPGPEGPVLGVDRVSK